MIINGHDHERIVCTVYSCHNILAFDMMIKSDKWNVNNINNSCRKKIKLHPFCDRTPLWWENFLQQHSSNNIWKSNSTLWWLDLMGFKYTVTPYDTRCGSPSGCKTRWVDPTRHVSGKCGVSRGYFYEYCEKYFLLSVKGWSGGIFLCTLIRGCRGVLLSLGRTLCGCMCETIFAGKFLLGYRGVWLA